MKKQRFSRSELIHAYTYIVKDGNQSDEEGRCPICGSRKILGESSAYPLNYDFLSAMHKLTF